MSSPRHALLLLGSPRALNKSTSHSMGVYLLRLLEESGVETSLVHIHRALRSREGVLNLVESFEQADLVILSCPLYVDCLPAPVIRCLELVADKAETSHTNEKGFVSIVNCGFPESRHTDVALAICRRFAHEVGVKWMGGLGLGGGEAIGGKSLDQAGGIARKIRRSLRLSAESLMQGQAVPSKAEELIAKPLIPVWIYKWIGDRGWRRQAKQYHVEKNLMSRPFQ